MATFFVTLKCIYSGSERRGNTFPSKLLFPSRRPERILRALFLGTHYAKWVSPVCHPETYLFRVLFLILLAKCIPKKTKDEIPKQDSG